MTGSRLGLAAALAALAPLATVAPLAGQSIRATGTTTVRYVELRPLVVDSVPVEETRGDGLLRRGPDGQVVRCITGARHCGYLASGATASTTPAYQDLTLSAWGFGTGLRAYAHLRGRSVLGGEDGLWPRADDGFDALAAYLELDRRRFRIRAGRQWVTSGLGFYNFDGGAVEVRPVEGLSVEGWGGRSLVRGVSEPRTGGALASVEPFAPREADFLVGGRIAWRGTEGLVLSGLYQREVRNDRKGLHAERAALDATWRRGRTELTGTLEADLATRAVNDARLEATLRPTPETGVAALYRWYRPYFEAWTIWGAFDPVGYSEVGGRGWWRPADHPVTAELRLSWRTYRDAEAASTFGTFRGTGWRAVATATWTPAPAWAVQGRLGTDIGFGAARDEGSLRVRRSFGTGAHLGVALQAFERAYEFRVDEGTVWGATADGGVRLSPRLRVDGSVTAFRHSADPDLPTPDWSQLRGTLTARWTVGREPVAGGRR